MRILVLLTTKYSHWPLQPLFFSYCTEVAPSGTSISTSVWYFAPCLVNSQVTRYMYPSYVLILSALTT